MPCQTDRDQGSSQPARMPVTFNASVERSSRNGPAIEDVNFTEDQVRESVKKQLAAAHAEASEAHSAQIAQYDQVVNGLLSKIADIGQEDHGSTPRFEELEKQEIPPRRRCV